MGRSQPRIGAGISRQGRCCWLLMLAAWSVAGAPTCQDSLSPADCAYFASQYTCDACCLPGHQSVRTACRATCGFCTPPTNGSSYHTEHLALMRLYQVTRGGSWARKDSWLNNSISHCLWFGVNCDAAGGVVSLKLQDNEVTGNVPVQLANLTQLTVLDLGTNSLRQPHSAHYVRPG